MSSKRNKDDDDTITADNTPSNINAKRYKHGNNDDGGDGDDERDEQEPTESIVDTTNSTRTEVVVVKSEDENGTIANSTDIIVKSEEDNNGNTTSTYTSVVVVKSEPVDEEEEKDLVADFFDEEEETSKMHPFMRIRRNYKDPKQRFKNSDKLTEACKNIKYIYKDIETFYAALELYNREAAKPVVTKAWWIPRDEPEISYIQWKVIRGWERQEIRGHHRTPCSQCYVDLPRPYDSDSYYLKDQKEGTVHYSKACEGCMGRNLCYRYGTDKKAIINELEEWRTKQKEFCNLQRYQDTYRGEGLWMENKSFLINKRLPPEKADVLIQHCMDGNKLLAENWTEIEEGQALTVVKEGDND